MINKFINNNEFIKLFEKIYDEKYGFNDNLRNFHQILESPLINSTDVTFNKQIKTLGIDDRKSVFISDYHNYIDQNSLFLNDIYHRFIKEHVKPLFPNDTFIVIQKTPNLRISFPNVTAIGKSTNDTNDAVGMHKDSDFGHCKDEINYIIPITEMFDTNSLYYEPYAQSNCSTEDFLNLTLTTNEYFIGNLNNLLHFNKINATGLTRISLDFRIIPYNKYMANLDYFKDTKFELGKYYILLKI